MKVKHEIEGHLISELEKMRQRITELETIEAEHQQMAEQNLRNFLENSPLGILISNAEAEIFYANKALLDIFGYSNLEEMKRVPIKERYLPESYAELKDRIKMRKQDKSVPTHYDTSIVRKNGEIRHLDISHSEVIWGGEKRFRVIYKDVTERKAMEEELSAARQNFHNSLDNSPMGISILSQEDEILYANQVYLDIYGYSSLEELKSISKEERFTPESYADHQRRMERVRQGKDVPSNFELSVVNKKGEIRHLEVFRKGVIWDGKRQYQLLFQDITERKRAEVELREAEQNFRNSLENSPLGIRIMTKKGESLYTNKALLDIYGYSSLEEFNATPIKQRHTPQSYAEHLERQKGRREGKTIPPHYEVAIVRRDGEIRFLDVLSKEVIWDRKTNLQVISQDITERKQAEAQLLTYQRELRSLASQLSLAEERERRRIATGLHDRVSQTMALCRLKLGALTESLPSPRFAEPLSEIQALIKQTIDEMRSLTFELSSPLLYELGLEAAVEQHTEQLEEQYGILFNFEDDGQPKPLENDIRILMFHTVRELLANVIKHAQASQVRVCMKKDGSDLCIIVEDDGIGFDTSEIDSRRKRIMGFGLFNIRERLHYISGNVEIVSQNERGTRVTVTVPLKQE